MIKLLKNNVKCQGHLKVTMLHVCEKVLTYVCVCVCVCVYEVNQLTNDKVIEEKKNVNANC